jgi:Family of unknown function (DUF6477)
MPELRDHVAALRRPQLLIRAARIGLVEYNRSRDLCRLMRLTSVPTPARALAGLIDAEGEMESTRRQGAASYNVARHVELLIALMGEIKLMPQSADGS